MMKLTTLVFMVASLPLLFSAQAVADTPWGRGKVNPIEYKPQKVVYDVSVDTVGEVDHVLDRVSYLSKITGADPFDSSIVIVLHGPELSYYAIENYGKYKALVDRAQSLTVGGTIKIKMCKIAAEGQGYKPEDIHGFIELVPMGDAEIVRLQTEEGHAYMQ
jgi:intracellular sulfur oxidation DsrE/DsrF family protein